MVPSDGSYGPYFKPLSITFLWKGLPELLGYSRNISLKIYQHRTTDNIFIGMVSGMRVHAFNLISKEAEEGRFQ